jgi:hypothetical protein
MKMDNSIFGLRFGSNVSLQPTYVELRMFLASKKKEGGRELHGSVLAAYNEVLESVLSFRRGGLPDAPARDEHERMFYGALAHSLFYHPGLKSAVELFKYQLHALSAIDFRKPRAFINTAEQAISLLDPGKKADAATKAKMQDMVDERKKLLEALTGRRLALVDEVGYLALYIRDNLLRIANRCETSIVVLVESSIERMKENQLIEDIKLHFTEQLEDSLHDGLASGQRPGNAENDVALLSKEIASTFRENIFALAQLYESIYDHTLKTVREIDTLMGENRRTKDRSFAEEVELFTRIEQVLDTLVSRGRFELKSAETKSETTHKDIFLKKRSEMFDHLSELMQKDRRTWLRRSRETRRRADDIRYHNPERRSESDRRTVTDRRRALSLSVSA